MTRNAKRSSKPRSVCFGTIVVGMRNAPGDGSDTLPVLQADARRKTERCVSRA